MKEDLDFPLYCTNCREDFTAENFLNKADEPYLHQLERIVDFCLLERLKQELQQLNKVEKMYCEFPESKDKMVPHIFLGENSPPTSKEIELWTNGDKQLEEFLLTTSFKLDVRKSYVEKSIEEENIEPVICPKCKNGVIIFKEGRLREFEPKLT